MEIVGIILIIIGIVLLIIEAFIPGFGVAGGLGIASVVGGIILVANTPAEGIMMFLIMLVLLSAMMYFLMKYVSKQPFRRSDIVKEGSTALKYYLNKEGVAVTHLRPAGSAEIDGVKLNVTAVDNFIDKGKKIKVVEIVDNAIVVSDDFS